MPEVAPSAIRDVYVLVRRRGHLLLLRRDGTGYRDGEWGPPSGKVDPDESYRAAAARELLEETGLRVARSRFALRTVLDRAPEPGESCHWIGGFFDVELTDDDGHAVNREPSKHGALEWWPLDGLPDTVVDYVAHVFALPPGTTYADWPPDADQS